MRILSRFAMALAMLAFAAPSTFAMSRPPEIPQPKADVIAQSEMDAVTAVFTTANDYYVAAPDHGPLGGAFDALNVSYGDEQAAFSQSNRLAFNTARTQVLAKASALCTATGHTC